MTFRKAVKVKLVEIDKTQTWLSEELKGRYGIYMDRFYLSRILAGQVNSVNTIDKICEILSIDKEEVDWPKK